MAAPSVSETDDARLRDIIIKVDLAKLSSLKHDHAQKLGVAILGFPFDEGCVRNEGRPGAKHGPSVFREHIYKIGCHPNAERNLTLSDKLVIYDVGDIDARLKYDAAHSALTQSVHQLLSHQLIPFIIGGSNDQSYSNFVAFTRHLQTQQQSNNNNKNDENKLNFGVVNIDAHFDVRPKKNGLEHSGSPFRMMLESELYQHNNGSFTEFAVQGHQCSAQHCEFIKAHKDTQIVWLDADLRKRQREQSNRLPVSLKRACKKWPWQTRNCSSRLMSIQSASPNVRVFRVRRPSD